MMRFFFVFIISSITGPKGYSQGKQFPYNDDNRPIVCYSPALPEFPGGRKAMIRFIKTHIKYPEQAIKDNVEGTIIIKYLVGKNGKLSQFQIIQSLSRECNAEVIRVFKLMPLWKPGDNAGGNLYFQFPVTFEL